MREGGTRGDERKARKSGIQWPVSSREGTYVMLDVNATERKRGEAQVLHGMRAVGVRDGERDREEERERSERGAEQRETESRTSERAHVSWWMNNGTPHNTAISPIPRRPP